MNRGMWAVFEVFFDITRGRHASGVISRAGVYDAGAAMLASARRLAFSAGQQHSLPQRCSPPSSDGGDLLAVSLALFAFSTPSAGHRHMRVQRPIIGWGAGNQL